MFVTLNEGRKPPRLGAVTWGKRKKRATEAYSGTSKRKKDRKARRLRRLKGSPMPETPEGQLKATSLLRAAGYIPKKIRCTHCKWSLGEPFVRNEKNVYQRCSNTHCRRNINVLTAAKWLQHIQRIGLSPMQLHALLMAHTSSHLSKPKSPHELARSIGSSYKPVAKILQAIRYLESLEGERINKSCKMSGALELDATSLRKVRDPKLSAAQIPTEPQEAVKGASIFPWRPLTWLMAMRVRPRLRTSNMRLLLVDKCLTCAIYICLISVPLRLINVQLRTVLAVGGVGGLAVGLALQNLVQNLISGILIYTNATICEGLEVELQDVKLQGVVSNVGWFNTTVNGYEGTRVTVPNRRILDGTVIDKTNKRFRVCQKYLFVTFQDPGNLEALVNAVQDDLRNNPNILQRSAVLRISMAQRGHIKIYEPQFVLSGWSEYGAQFYIRAYFDKSLQGDRFLQLQSQVLVAVSKRIKQFGGRLGSPLTPLLPAPDPAPQVPKQAPDETNTKLLAKRRAIAYSYLSRQPVCRTRHTRLAPWTWLEPGLAQPKATWSPEQPAVLQAPPLPEAPAKQPALALTESAHERLERQAACRHVAKVLAERFGQGNEESGRLEDLLVAKESEVVKLTQEVTLLRSEKEQLEFALEAAERRIEELVTSSRASAAPPEVPPPAESKEAAAVTLSKEAPKEGIASAQLLPNDSRNPRDQVAAIRNERLEGIRSATMREMFLGCVELLAADIYASRAHFVLELLQNADDNEYAAGIDPTARFICEGGQRPYIAVINNEVGLTVQDLVGMCAISKSAKKDKADRTGRKGIGFKSVFAVSSCPHVLSRSYTFKFDVRHDRMGYVMPSWVEQKDLSECVPTELLQLHQEGYTVIFLPMADSSEALLKEVEGHLEARSALDPATLLFMRRLQRVDFRRADGRTSSMRIEGRGPADGQQKELVNIITEVAGTSSRTSHEFFVARRVLKGGCNGRAFQPLAVALPVQADVPQKAFATLPLCHTGLNVCINADWDVSASRDGVHENSHNEELSLQAAEAFAQLAQECGQRLEASPVEYLGDRPPLSRFWRKVRERFIHALLHADVPCLAVEEAGPEMRFVSPKQALRRPQHGAPEKGSALAAAAELVSGATLLASVQRYFVREPLPQGLQLETFATSHFARCLPNLIKAALALEEYVDRVKKLTQIYLAFEELLSDPRCGVATVQERADLAREAVCWPCMVNGEGCVLCAGSIGAIFVASDSQDRYDANNEEEDEKTNMIAFLPTMKLPVEVQPPDKMLCEHPFDAYILARGADARKTVQFFVAGVCAEYGGKTDGESRFKIGEAGLITIFTEYQNDLREAVEDLQNREFNYTEATRLTLKGHGSTEKTAKYDVITKSTISDEVQKVANLADVKVSFRHAPDWLDDANTPKYMKVSVAGVVHFFNLRVRACRLLKHKHLGSLPNRREQDHMSDSQELSDTEVEHVAAEPLAWKFLQTTVRTVGTTRIAAMAKDVNVLKVLKKDAQVRQKQSSRPSKPAKTEVPPAHQFFVSQNWKSLIERRPDVAPKAKEQERKVVGLVGRNVVAMDCEMVGVGPSGTRSVLARVSIVDCEGNVLLDKYVRPNEYVTDFRTPITGITKATFYREGVISEDEAREMAAKVMEGKIVVGHSLQNDFQALLLSHPHVLIRDTSLYRPLRPPGQKKTPSLRKLALHWLQEKIQDGTHDSIQDAKTALRLYMLKSKAWEKQMQSAMQHRSAEQNSVEMDDEDNGEQVERDSVAPRKKKVKKLKDKRSTAAEPPKTKEVAAPPKKSKKRKKRGAAS
eukprot:s459_g4.t2